MKYTVHIRLNRTGTVVQAHYDYDVDAELIRFNWAENNFSCDCNRSLEFRRALYPNPPPENPYWNNTTTRCGGWGPKRRYSVPFIDLETGERLYIDDEPGRFD